MLLLLLTFIQCFFFCCCHLMHSIRIQSFERLWKSKIRSKRLTYVWKMDYYSTCFVCRKSVDCFHENLRSMKTMHSKMPICAAIKLILNKESSSIHSLNKSSIVCYGCVGKINEFDTAQMKMQQIQRELNRLHENSNLMCPVSSQFNKHEVDEVDIADNGNDQQENGKHHDPIPIIPIIRWYRSIKHFNAQMQHLCTIIRKVRIHLFDYLLVVYWRESFPSTVILIWLTIVNIARNHSLQTVPSQLNTKRSERLAEMWMGKRNTHVTYAIRVTQVDKICR